MKILPVFETIDLWRQQIEDPAVEGLYVDNRQRLMLDIRARVGSLSYDIAGPRSVDLNLVGPEQIVVPGDVAFSYIQEALGLRSELAKAKQPTSWMGIH